MTDQPYMALWVADFLGDTLHLSAKEVGQYFLLLMAMWQHGGELTDDSKKLARVARGKVTPAVMAYFKHADGKISQKRLLKELNYVRDFSAKQSANAKVRWLKNKETGNATAYAKDMPDACPHTHTHIKEKETRASALGLQKEFHESFWPKYPHKVGKAAALKSYLSARRKCTEAEIVAGVARYVAAKPHDRAWCNPTTFLNQERWLDQPAEVSPLKPNGHGTHLSGRLPVFEREPVRTLSAEERAERLAKSEEIIKRLATNKH